jgi:spermidine synthase
VIPWVHLDSADIPGGSEPLRLMQRGSEFSIRLGQNELMNSRVSGSEQALAAIGCAPIAARPQPRVLIGGLGMGFTLRAALALLPPDAEIVVAELVPSVVAWARGPMAELFGGSLEDPRVSVVEDDVAAQIRASQRHYDAILLDVDNGPDGLSRSANDALYDHAGLRAAHTALRAGGVLAVWSSGPDGAFTKRLRQSNFSVEEITHRARGKSGGARHVIWKATRA